jgi:hypothetical protein
MKTVNKHLLFIAGYPEVVIVLMVAHEVLQEFLAAIILWNMILEFTH